jgi:anti-sigma regulatory factor (Ser/Thr protein kinase)
VSDEHVLVRVPAKPELVRVLRAVASSVATRSEMSFEAVEEVRIAVDEAATLRDTAEAMVAESIAKRLY